MGATASIVMEVASEDIQLPLHSVSKLLSRNSGLLGNEYSKDPKLLYYKRYY